MLQPNVVQFSKPDRDASGQDDVQSPFVECGKNRGGDGLSLVFTEHKDTAGIFSAMELVLKDLERFSIR